MRKLLRYLKNYKKESIIGPLFKLTEAIFELIVPLVMSDIIDIGVAQADTAYILKKGALLLLFGFVGLCCSLTAQYFAAKASVGFGTELRHDMFSYFMSLSYAEHDEIGAATLINRLTVDVNQVQSGVNLGIRLLLRSPFIVVGAVIMSFTVDAQLALIVLVATPVIALVVYLIVVKTVPMFKQIQGRLDRISALSRGNLNGIRVIRAFARQEKEKEGFDAVTDDLYDISIHTGRISALLNPLTYVLLNIAVALVIWYGGVGVNTGRLTQGEVIALVNYLSQILLALIAMVNLINSLTKAIASAARINEVFDPDVKASPDPLKVSALNEGCGQRQVSDASVQTAAVQAYSESVQTGAGQASCGSVQNGAVQETYDSGQSEMPEAAASANRRPGTSVTFKNVSFAYPGAKENTLEGIDFSIGAGETLGIIGGTGAGKTTLINLMSGFYAVTGGNILINGCDIRFVETKELRETFSVVAQKKNLFKGTIRDNLKFGREADDEELARALEISQAAEFVNKPEVGLDFMVEQGGTNLSGGQQQRLTIARALVNCGSVLILDDSASALDFATDAALRKAIAAQTRELTTVIVSQRIGSIMGADRILVLDDGHQAGFGTHDDLLETCPVYREIYDSQTK